MVPFRLPKWRKKQINAKYRRKSRVIVSTVDSMEKAMLKAINSIVSSWELTNHYMQPSLNEMFIISEEFYRDVIKQAFISAEEEKNLQISKKKLAKGPTGIPHSLKDLEQIFRNSKQWRKIQKRSYKLTEKLRKQYLDKLKKKFNKLAPQLQEGEITTKEAKDQMIEVWNTSKARVETIFRTETTNYFGRTQVAFFENNDDIIGFLFDSIKDSSRTNVCRSRHGLIYRPDTDLLKENTPALHWNCRSQLIALANTEYNRKLLLDPSRNPNKVSVAPLPKGWRK